MEWRVFLATFGLVLLSELGDKSQLLTMTLVAESRANAPVFLGAALALLLATLLGVLFGEVLSSLVPPVWIRMLAGSAFVFIGGALLLGKL
ncbi:MAG: TMEM165/GDT1 family protein [Firmicutes bacterium]|nr:TMEM165/GDT1 family protein [Bacillota bacterium]